MKKHFFGIAAIAIAFLAFAFTPQKQQQLKNTDPSWYYTGTDTGGHGTASLYEKLNAQDVSLCDEDASDVRCVIQAPELVIMDEPQGVPDLTSEPIVVSFKPE
jgi:hypothetical protein